MTYEEVPVTAPVLAWMWASLWERGVEEFSRVGLTSQQGFDLFMEHAAKAERSGILCCDGKPVAVAGVVQEPAESFTFMQATRDFDDHARAIVRWLRRRLNGCRPPLHIYSVCVHPGTERFFRALGFRRDEWQHLLPSGHPLFRFKRR